MANKFSDKAKKLLKSQEIARIATLTKEGYPHVAPMWFVADDRYVYFATDSTSLKIANIGRNSKVAVLVDSQDWHNPEGILIQGKAEVLKKGDGDFGHSLNLMIGRFPNEKKYEGPKQRVIRVTPIKIAYWKFNS
jgi:general stress protein 26